MAELTPKQAAIRDAIVEYWQEYGQGPTLRDLADAANIKHLTTLTGQLKALAKKGAIEWERNRVSRGIWPAGLRQAIRELTATF